MRPILHKTYTRLLMGMYEFGGPLPMEARQLGHLLELRPQDVRGLLYELAEAGKIEIKDGFVHNKRTDHELSRGPSNGGSNGGSNGAPVDGSMDAPVGSHSDKKLNENHTRAGDHTHARRAPATHFIEGGAPGLHDGPRAALPTSEVSSSASEARKKNGFGNGDNLPRRRTSEWDMPSAPGPTGQTKFLQAEAAFQAGDKAALDPLPGVPWAGAGAYSINGRNLVRRQLGMPPLEEIHETELPTPPADQDDDAVIRGNEQPPSRSSPEADQACARDSNQKTPAPGTGAKHADPRNPNNESKPPLSDEDFGGLP